jgi:hypothetical protein
MKLYCFFTPSHRKFYEEWLLPSAQSEYEICPHEHPNQISHTAEYAREGWRETQYEKVNYWISSIKENFGDVIVCSDVDVQFLKESSSFLLNSLGDADFAFQRNSEGGTLCSGFFVCRCGPKAVQFFKRIKAQLARVLGIPGGGEQYEMRDLLKGDWCKNEIKYKYLDRNKIWNPGSAYEDPKELNIPQEILVHHANWVHGEEKKIDQLTYVKSIAESLPPWPEIPKPERGSSPYGPKIAICMSSLLRGFDVFSTSIICRLINTLPSKPDLICHFPTQSKTKFNLRALDEIKKHCREFNIKFEPDPQLPKEHLSMIENMTPQRNGVKGNLLQWASMKSCGAMLSKKEELMGSEYDWVIWTRPDLYYFNSLDNILNLDNNSYHVPAHDNHLQGMFDRFCLGNSQNIKNRLNIYDYFTKIWYPNYSHDENHLTWNAYRKSYKWNPELCHRHYIREELNLEVNKINFCVGKIRNSVYATAPFWYSVYGNERTGLSCSEDIVNHEILSRINALDNYKMFGGSSWPIVNILDDTIMYNHPQNKLKSKSFSPLELNGLGDKQEFKLSFLTRFSSWVDEVILKMGRK